jgi:hypothetical protein
VAHFHYVMMGSTLVAFLGALHYWYPKFTGKMYPESLGQICSLGVFFGFNLTFLPQFVMGSRGMPRRYWDYDPQYQIFHQLSTIGAYVLGISIFISVVYLFWCFKYGRPAPRNPWGGSSLEWQCPTPPTLYNFEKPPVLHELYNYDDLVEVEEDVWERTTPIEDTSERADMLARKMGQAADHTAGASATERRLATANTKAEEAKSESSLTEKTKGAPAGKTPDQVEVETAERGQVVAARDELKKEAAKASADAAKVAKTEEAAPKPIEETPGSVTGGWDVPDEKDKK